MYQDNLAYDLSLFDVDEEQEKKKAKKRAESRIKTAKSRTHTIPV